MGLSACNISGQPHLAMKLRYSMNLETRSFIALLLLVTVLFGVLVVDFFQPVFWAAALAVIFHPVENRILAAGGGRKSVAAFLTLLVICLTVILPLWFVKETGSVHPGRCGRVDHRHRCADHDICATAGPGGQ